MTSFGYQWGITGGWWYFIWFAVCGAAESCGYPPLTAVMGNWFGKKGRGVIFGAWSTHANVGNIIGVLFGYTLFDLAGFSWMTTYIVAGLFCALMGFLIFLFLVEEPAHVDLYVPELAASEEQLFKTMYNASLLTREEREHSHDVAAGAGPAAGGANA